MVITVIDYEAGNVSSVLFALQRLGYEARLSHAPEEIKSSDRVVLPGVGQARHAMENLSKRGLDKLIPALRQPVLGICLGMQLMCRHTEEGDTAGLGIFDVDVIRFPRGERVPQIGWNRLFGLKSPLFADVPEDTYVYLAHSFYAPLSPDTGAAIHYGLTYSGSMEKGNFYGVQFHPEKSGLWGAKILENFIKQV